MKGGVKRSEGRRGGVKGGVRRGEERGEEERKGVDVIRTVVSRHTRVKTKTQRLIRLRSKFGF